MQENRTRHALGAWVRGTLLALTIVGAVALAALWPRVLAAEHRWMVARCPIAYVGEDGRIHLTNERGTLDVELEAVAWSGGEDPYLSYFSPRPAWSPNGQFIAHTWMENIPAERFEATVMVIELATGRTWRPLVSPQVSFGGWVREGVINVEGQLIEARTGAFVPKPEWADSMLWISPVPERGGGGWIVVGAHGLHFRTEDFRMRMPIWSSYGQAVDPRVDPSGKWAGCTSMAGRYGDIQIKLIEETVAKKPRNVWPPGVGSVFCDWTSDGNIFANVSERGQWGLVVLDRDGTVLRRVVTEVRPLAGSGASWRGMGGGSK